MIPLLRLTLLPYWRRHPVLALLPALGVALGVAAIVAIDLGSSSAVEGFRRTAERLEGRATLQILPGTAHLDGRLACELAELPGVEAAAPVLECFALVRPRGTGARSAAGARGEAGERSSLAAHGEAGSATRVEEGEPLRVLGIDPLAEARVRALGLPQAQQGELFARFLGEPGALAVSDPFLRRHALAAGDTLQLAVGAHARTAFVLTALPRDVDGLRVPDNLALCDLATAQELAGRDDVSRIDLALEEPGRARALAAITARLPPGVELVAAGGRAQRLAGMLAALRTNLTALSYLALFVSLFLIYDSMLLAVLRRRRDIGILRCLGATRRDVIAAWTAEAALTGVAGTVVGFALGIAGGGLALRGVAQTASDLYGYVRGDALMLSPWTFVKAAVAGLLATLVAAALPAGEAARTTPAHTSLRSEVESAAARRSRRAPWLALPLSAVLAGCLAWPSRSPVPGYVAAVALALAGALLAPLAGDALLRLGQPLLRATLGILPAMAARNIRASMSRTAVALAALSVALSMSLAMGTMVASFRTELQDWIADAVRADVYVTPATARLDRFDAHLDAALVDELRARPEVLDMDTLRGLPAQLLGARLADSGGDVGAGSRLGSGTAGGVDGASAAPETLSTAIVGVETDVYRTRARPKLLSGPAPEEFFRRLRAGQAGIAESLMRKTGLAAGDHLRVRAAGRLVELTVAGVYRDYSSDRGVVLMDRAPWEALFGARQPNSIALYLDAKADVDTEVTALQHDLGSRYQLLLRSNRALREEALRVFDRTFAVTRALEIIGIAVAAIGVLAALLAMLLERRRELATLRALGLTQRQMDALLLAESALLAVLAWAFSLVLGTALAEILLRWINLRSFGWSLPLRLPLGQWMANLGLALLAAVLATVYPLARARRESLALALREE
jgi:putative ABC transport system permease protein